MKTFNKIKSLIRKKPLYRALTLIVFILIFFGIIYLTLSGIINKFDKVNNDPRSIVTGYETPSGIPYWQIAAGAANALLIPCDEGYMLIDTGYPEDYPRFLSGMEAEGLDIQEIRFLFITHAHDEHAGFAAELKRSTGCQLIIPERSIEGLASGEFVWEGVSVNPFIHFLGAIYNKIKNRNFSFEPVIPGDDDFILSGNSSDICRKWGIPGTFWYTPGHTEDSWSLILDDGTAIVGDAAMNTLLPFGAGYRPIFMEERKEVYRSIDLIRKKGGSLILTGHGSAFSAEKLPHYISQTATGPGLATISEYFTRFSPGFILILLLLFFEKTIKNDNRNSSVSLFRLFLYILGFILMRDLMTPFGYWTFGSDPVFWIRWAADGKLLLFFAGGSLVFSSLILFRERNAGVKLIWIQNRKKKSAALLFTILAGIAGAFLVTLPSLLIYRGFLPGERGGLFPRNLLPAVLLVSLSGNLLEEILFRGYFQKWCKEKGFSPIKAAFSSGLLFGLCHTFLAYTVTDAGLPLIIFALWEGILCGLIKEKFGLIGSVLTHGLAIAILTIV